MAEANQTIKKVLNHLNSKIGTGGVVDKWSDGQGNFWRKYADGWIEQGGKVLKDKSLVEVSLPKSFSSTDFTIVALFVGMNTSTSCSVSEKSTSNIKFWSNTSSANVYIEYMACGY